MFFTLTIPIQYNIPEIFPSLPQTTHLSSLTPHHHRRRHLHQPSPTIATQYNNNEKKNNNRQEPQAAATRDGGWFGDTIIEDCALPLVFPLNLSVSTFFPYFVFLFS
ncbi:hypothetical protein PIB30_106615 [Stylosanthes scabra]|uniref:Uncharacterized protein n=1 Tax=Stylosanthes scabra TaxID=79078 RepID=A0ABU6SZP4_9FABA|nr:hypothetical protein [Stylosanthes scabra]